MWTLRVLSERNRLFSPSVAQWMWIVMHLKHASYEYPLFHVGPSPAARSKAGDTVGGNFCPTTAKAYGGGGLSYLSVPGWNNRTKERQARPGNASLDFRTTTQLDSHTHILSQSTRSELFWMKFISETLQKCCTTLQAWEFVARKILNFNSPSVEGGRQISRPASRVGLMMKATSADA